MRLVPPRIRERVTDRVTRVGDAGHNGAPDAVPQVPGEPSARVSTYTLFTPSRKVGSIII
jgi:hypothetical protein